MPFPMKVQPIDLSANLDGAQKSIYTISKPASRSRLKRLFDLPFTNNVPRSGEEVIEFEPNSVALDKMVRNFMEDNEKTPAMSSTGRYGGSLCNCFNRSINDDNSDDEFDFDLSDSMSSFYDSCEMLKSLIPCQSKDERNLLADTSKIVDKNKACKQKDELVKIVVDSLLALNYDAALCKSKWEKSSSCPAGEYEYIDVVIEGERILIDIDFRSEFEIARSTGNYRTILKLLPIIFVGKSDRISQIIAIAGEAAMQSLKKKGMHVAPWRKVEYIKSKWLENFNRIYPINDVVFKEKKDFLPINYASYNAVSIEKRMDETGVYEGGELDLVSGEGEVKVYNGKNGEAEEKKDFLPLNYIRYNAIIVEKCTVESGVCEGEELDLIFGDEMTSFEVENLRINNYSDSVAPSEDVSGEGEKLDFSVKVPWQPPPVKLKSNEGIVTGLASLLKEKF